MKRSAPVAPRRCCVRTRSLKTKCRVWWCQFFAQDAHAVLDFAREQPEVDKRRVYLYGRSLGGAIAFRLAQERASDVRSMWRCFVSCCVCVGAVAWEAARFRCTLSFVVRYHGVLLALSSGRWCHCGKHVSEHRPHGGPLVSDSGAVQVPVATALQDT